MWRARQRPAPPAPPADATVDVFITTYNEPEELVRATAIAARAIRYPHETYILDDGARPTVRALAEEVGVGAAPAVFLIFGILPVSSTAVEFFLRFLPFLILSQLMFLVVGRGMSTWRGQQYSLALFPVWITACWTAVMNVFFGRPLDFVVTSKERQRLPNPLLVVRWQVVASVVLLVATVVGVVRLAMGVGEPLGTAINVGWVVFDLVMFSVLVSAVRFRGYEAAPQSESARFESAQSESAQPEKKEAS